MVSALKMTPAASILTSTNPGRNYESLGTVNVSSPADIDAAVAAAKKAQGAWAALGVKGRIAALEKVVKAIDAHKDALAELTAKEMGMPITAAIGTHDWSMDHMRWYLDHAQEALEPETTFENEEEIHQVVPEPYGVAAVIVPWNFPLSNFVMGAFQPLLAGNTVVLKFSEEVPLFSQKLDAVMKEAGLPQGVYTTIYGAGDVGEKLARANVDMICFTGSTATGKKLYAIGAEKFIPVHLELGGSDAGIVCEDADVEALAESMFWSKFSNCGQVCCGLKRLLVHESKYDQTLKALKKVAASVKHGDPMEEDTQLGPLAAQRQLVLLQSQVDDAKAKGAVFETGGKTPGHVKGAYFEPTLVTGIKKDMRIWTEEVFGPVLPIVTFKTDDEAIAMANDTPWGLSAYIFTADTARAKKIAGALKVGSVSHNGTDYSGPHNTFGGYKASGLKRTGGKQGFRDACQMKAVCLKK